MAKNNTKQVQSHRIEPNIVAGGNYLHTKILNGETDLILYAALNSNHNGSFEIGLAGDLSQHSLEVEKVINELLILAQERIDKLTKVSVVDLCA